jgi:EcsC protein family
VPQNIGQCVINAVLVLASEELRVNSVEDGNAHECGTEKYHLSLPLVRFIAQVASRFGVVVTQKVAAQTVPVVGALGGAAVNHAFIEHFQEVARGHFTVRRLERVYGKDVVRTEYERLAQHR